RVEGWAPTSASGVPGSRAGFRFLCLRACGFESHLAHQDVLTRALTKEVGEYERLGILEGAPLGRAVPFAHGPHGVRHGGFVEFAHWFGLLIGDDAVLLDPELGVRGEVEVPPGLVGRLRIQVVWPLQQGEPPWVCWLFRVAVGMSGAPV